MSYAFPPGGLPSQAHSPEGRAIFTAAYALIPASVQTDIVTSFLPGWRNTRAWILARPLSGFAESFAQYAVEIAPEGGSETPEPDRHAQAVLFIAHGALRLRLGPATHELTAGTMAYLPPSAPWSIWNHTDAPCRFHWIRKRYVPAQGESIPEPKFLHEAEIPKANMPGTDRWSTQRFLDPLDLGYDMHCNIVTFKPGGRIPFAETHVMEHGLYVLQGTGRYLLNRDWVDVGPGDFIWLRAFCPQACIATSPEPFRYLLYKDVNRHPPLHLGRADDVHPV